MTLEYGDVLTVMGLFVCVCGWIGGILLSTSPKAGKTISELLDDLLTNHTAIISISRIDETSICVSVVADWTGYTEQCFFNETMEGAVAMALEHKATCEKRKAGA